MTHQDISEKYSKWIIEYSSDNYLRPVFFIWFTDNSKEEIDQLFVDKTQKIIIANSKKELLKIILTNPIKIKDSDRMKKWLDESLNYSEISSTKYDLMGLEHKILSNELEPKDFGDIVNFINLYEDYQFQLGKEKEKSNSRKNGLSELWDYYYEEIFWKKFNQAPQNKNHPNSLIIDYVKLTKQFSKVVNEFESNFNFLEQ